MEINYEQYRLMCEYAQASPGGKRLPLRMTQQEEQEAIEAFKKLIWLEK